MAFASLTQFSDDSVSTSASERFGNHLKTEISAQTLLELRNSRNSSRISVGFPETQTVKNDKIRYYYNKTLCLRAPIQEMTGQLDKLHTSAFAYLSQYPQTGDYSVLGTLFELIIAVSGMIDWDSMNHSCYWGDFCRETKELSELLDKVNGAVLKCADATKEVLEKVTNIFQGMVEPVHQLLKSDTMLSYRRSTDYVVDSPSGRSIQIHWKKPGDVIDLQWHDADVGLLDVSLSQTGTGFRIRFLRHIIYYTRACLELAYNTFLKVTIAITLQIPIEKLERCQNVEMNKLTLQEQSFLTNAKRELDTSLSKIWSMSARFKYQTFNIMKYNKILKKMRNSKKYAPKSSPTFVKVSMNVEDSLLMRVISSGIQAQTKDESFDFTVYPDRTEDIIAKVEDLLVVDNKNYKELQQVLALMKILYPKEIDNFSTKERKDIVEEIGIIFAHRFCLRRWLKKSIKVFDTNSALRKMEQVKLLPTLREISKKGHNNVCFDESETRIIWSSEPSENAVPDNNNNLPEPDEKWITLGGGIKVTFNLVKGVLIKFPQKNTVKLYTELSADESVTLFIRLLRHLLFLVANDQCWAKVLYCKISETKSLVKSLKAKDRQDSNLQNTLTEQHKQIRQMLRLTKAMRFLKE